MTPRLLLTVGADLLCAVLADGRGADQTLFSYFQKHPQFGSRERRGLADAVYGCLRRLRSLGDTLGQSERSDWRLTTAEAQRRIATWMAGEGHWQREEIHAVLGDDIHFPREDAETLSPAVVADLPDWLYTMLSAELGAAETYTLAQALTQPAPLDLRVNSLRASRAEVVRQLQAEGIEAMLTPFSPVGLRLAARTPFSENLLYREGIVEIQDEGSQLIGFLLAPRRHEIVVDFCAGAGGKTLHLGALMANTGTLHAFDSAPRRLEQLRLRIDRAGLTTVRIARIDSLTAPPILALQGKVDRILVDAPCTGSGTVRRNPDIKWRHHDLAALITEQRRILATAATLLRPGGRLVYATCSLLPAENEEVIEDFLTSHSNFIQIPLDSLFIRLGIPRTLSKKNSALRLYPHHHGTDGFYAVLLEREAQSNSQGQLVQILS